MARAGEGSERVRWACSGSEANGNWRVVVDADGARRCPCLVVVSGDLVLVSLSRVVRDCYDALVGLAFSSGLAMAMEIGVGGGWMESCEEEGKGRLRFEIELGGVLSCGWGILGEDDCCLSPCPCLLFLLYVS
jgi:hypothetical protein